MELSVQVEKPSSILRKLTIKVPAKEVKNHFDKSLVNIQKTANLKGFRPGHAPLSVIKQYYGDDVRHRVYHNLIDESLEQAVKENKIRSVGNPKIDAADHQTGTGEHDHSLHEDQDLTFTATLEVIPEVTAKNYTGISLKKEKVEVTDEHVNQMMDHLRQSRAQLTPASSGIALADGTTSSRPAQQGDYVDFQLIGGLLEAGKVTLRDDMKGTHVLEIGSKSWIPGFEEHFVGMRPSESKTFRLSFPKDYAQQELAEKEAEFTVTVNEIKEKKLPALDDEFAKDAGHESLLDLKTKAREYLLKEKTEQSDSKLKGELIAALIEKNPFDVPQALIDSQARALVQDWAEELKRQGLTDDVVQETISRELESVKKRAENQVRASLILESIAGEEKITVGEEDLQAEIVRMAESMKVELNKINEYYAKNPGRMGDLEFRLRQERTVKFLLDSAKIKSVAPSEK